MKAKELKALDPLELFRKWYLEAEKLESNNPNACCLATTDIRGFPSARMILVKKFDERGFVFYTNLNSKKAENFSSNSKVALCFHWKSLSKQVRVEGSIMDLPSKEADDYFSSRDRDSQIGALISKQSKPLSGGISELDKKFKLEKAKLGTRKIARPSFWSGKIVRPEKIEFWSSRDYRLHERILYTTFNKGWKKEYLYP